MSANPLNLRNQFPCCVKEKENKIKIGLIKSRLWYGQLCALGMWQMKKENCRKYTTFIQVHKTFLAFSYANMYSNNM